ncbi:hypothetical protein LK542_21795 [Massilia sp. IC2-477]|uniref:hypothetical protein n=1 Tax=unclassified Massilia TaxID=2609279 RepID=UPI001D10F641|nr:MULTISPECIES: hypothetical protein [unclassified Massilia]MCC2958257.1 hypothetical protein [Massilia sp. IC2-477]MCC2973524.1 hypothetical protein [Massilia sp. IC2-476]
MPSSTSAPDQGRSSRYIVRAAADSHALGAFIDSLGAQPAIRLVDTIGPAGGPPHTVVVETDHDTAEQLKRRTLNQLTIEPDQPLSLFD